MKFVSQILLRDNLRLCHDISHDMLEYNNCDPDPLKTIITSNES